MTHDIGAIIEAIEQYTRGDDHQRAIDAAMQKERKWDADLAAPAVEGV